MSDKNIVRHNSIKLRKVGEHKTFIDMVGNGDLPDNWQDLAEVLGVTPKTICEWKKRPEFQKALVRGIKKSMDQMTKYGKRDWRMWRERYGMLMKEKNNNITTNIQVNVTPILGGKTNED